MVYFYAGTHKGKALELTAGPRHGAIGIVHGGEAIGSLDAQSARELLQWLVNHDQIDIDHVAERKRAFDTDEDCRCEKSGMFSKGKPSCPLHFAVG